MSASTQYRSLLLGLFTFLPACSVAGTAPDPDGPDSHAGSEDTVAPTLGLPNEVRVDDGVYIAAQPSPDQLRRLSEQGVRTVVNLRAADAATDEVERELVEAQGINYVSLAVGGPNELTLDFALRLASAVGSLESPTLMHCPDGNASSAVHALLVFLAGGSVEAALSSYSATGQSSWRESLRTQLETLCGMELGGCAPPIIDEPVDPSTQSPPGHPGELPNAALEAGT